MHKIRLYVAGAAPASTNAVEVVRSVCDEHLLGRYELEVVDVYQQPLLALRDQIMAVPTLVKTSPGRARRVLGPFSDRSRVLAGLDLNDKPPETKRRLEPKA